MATPPTGPAATSTSEPARSVVLTVCMGIEPKSLFLYGDSSVTARSVREAIFDGPVDLRGFQPQPVLLDKIPASSDGDVLLEPVQVQSGDSIMDSQGYLATIASGISYLPSGCSNRDCAQVYPGSGPVSMDQAVVRFKLRSGVDWSDGTALKASDSVYSYRLAGELFSNAEYDLLAHTASYTALDDSTLEWRGVPGYKPPLYTVYFFTPLPEHAWGELSSEALLSDERSARRPLGWGPYVIDEWTAGDHITLHKNPNYFRAGEGLPKFDRLVFRFMPDGQQAIDALLAGECDLVDETALGDEQFAQLLQLRGQGRLALAEESGQAWEHADFGILPATPQDANPFQFKEVRQAVAQCLDREALARVYFPDGSAVLNTYLLPEHPLYAADARAYPYDPQAANTLLDGAGWQDTDQDPATPRVAIGLPGLPPDTPLQFTYLTLPVGQPLAEAMRANLAECGIQMEIETLEADALFAPGPEGPIFGRRFQMAGFSWTSSAEPPCWLYTSSEIPGTYPEFPRGWGGANASGYSNSEFDAACLQARFELPDSTGYQEAQRQAQRIFAQDLPALPLFLRVRLAAMRTDLCGVRLDPSAESSLWNLEAFSLEGDCGE